MYKLFFLLSIVCSLWGYQPGDTVSAETVQRLGLEKGKSYVIDFFASWCVSCRHELPLVEKVSRQLDGTKSEVIGVDVDEDVNSGVSFQKELGLTFRVIDDPKGEIIQRFDPVGMPALYIIKNKKVTKVILGAKENIDRLITAALKESK